jgi:hypothetical protein
MPVRARVIMSCMLVMEKLKCIRALPALILQAIRLQ